MTDADATTSAAEAEAVGAAGHAPTARRATSTWVLLLTGPIAWFAHFGVVYLLAEAACEFAWLDDEWLGLETLSIAILVLTALFLVPVLVSTAMAWRRWRRTPVAGSDAPSGEQRQSADDPSGRGGSPDEAAHDRDGTVAFVSLALGLLFIASILAVGLPALVLQPC